MNNKKEILGKLFFGLSILMLCYMLISPLAKTIIHVDEFWTIGLINLPLAESIPLMISDVHPPIYYLILKAIVKSLSILGVQYNEIFLLKLISILPFVLILIIFATKVRRQYNWLTVGLFTLILSTLNMFFVQFLTIRMYSWGLFFLLMSFIYFREILYTSNKRSWILFTLFSVLVAYTHYFILITTFILYMILLIHILRDKYSQLNVKSELKKWIASVVAAIILYSPWLFIFLSQLSKRQHISESTFPSFMDIVNYFTYFTGTESAISFETIFIKIFAAVLLIAIIILFVREYKKERSIENSYIGIGLMLFFLTLITGVISTSLAFNIFTIKYLVPVASVFWFSVSILIGKLEDNRLFVISLILMVCLCISGVCQTVESSEFMCDEGANVMEIFEDLNNNNTVIVYTQEFHYVNFHHFLNETKEYKSKFPMPYTPKNIKTIRNMSKVSSEDLNKDVYVIKAIDYKLKNDFDNVTADNVTYEKYGNFYNIWFMHLKN